MHMSLINLYLSSTHLNILKEIVFVHLLKLQCGEGFNWPNTTVFTTAPKFLLRAGSMWDKFQNYLNTMSLSITVTIEEFLTYQPWHL